MRAAMGLGDTLMPYNAIYAPNNSSARFRWRARHSELALASLVLTVAVGPGASSQVGHANCTLPMLFPSAKCVQSPAVETTLKLESTGEVAPDSLMGQPFSLETSRMGEPLLGQLAK